MNIKLILEKISWYKLLFTVLVTLVVGTVSWFINNYFKVLFVLIIMDIIAFTGFSVGIIFCITKIRFYFKKLGEKEDV